MHSPTSLAPMPAVLSTLPSRCPGGPRARQPAGGRACRRRAAARWPSRWSRGLIAGLLLTLTLVPAASAADDLTTIRLAEAVNVLRAQNGLQALTVQAQLNQAAQSHADYLAMTNTFNHYGAGGSTQLNRIRATGYPMCAGTENLATGAWEPDVIVRLWASSSGHRADILGSQYTELGVGRSQSRSGEVYWVLVEGKPCGPGETPPTFVNIGGMSMPLVSSLPDGLGGTASLSGGSPGYGGYSGYPSYGLGSPGVGGYAGYPSYGLGGYGTGAYGSGGYGLGGYSTGGYGQAGYGLGGYGLGGYGIGGYGQGGYGPLGYGLGGYGPVGYGGGAYSPWDSYGGPGWAGTGYGGWASRGYSGWGSPGYGGYAPAWGPSVSAWGPPR